MNELKEKVLIRVQAFSFYKHKLIVECTLMGLKNYTWMFV